MFQKLMIGALGVLIIGVIALGVYSARPGDLPQMADPTSTTRGHAFSTTASNAAVIPAPQVNAVENVGTVWTGAGTIVSLEDFGFTLEMADASSVYVELGPPDFWQAQGIELADGASVAVDGFDNGDQIHARVVYTDTGALTIRTEAGQPLWAGGVANVQGQGQNGESLGTGQAEFQVQPEDWVTITGTITSTTNGGLTVTTNTGGLLSLQMGRPDFWQSQGVMLAAGDAVELLGFWSNGQFIPGDITKTQTGEHIILRDPNGRQLWGGPGRNGAANGAGNGNNGNNGAGNGRAAHTTG